MWKCGPRILRAAGEASSLDGSDAGKRIQALDRALILLKAVAGSATPPTALDLARACRINRSTAWRLLRTMEHHGLVDRDAVTQRYTVGYTAVALAGAAADDALARRARPLLADLAARTGEPVSLAVAKESFLVPIDQVDPPDVTMPSWKGKALPLHATSGGKVLLAWMAPSDRDAMLPKALQRYTDRTITDHEQLGREIEAVSRTGYAMSIREYENFTSGASAAILSARQWPVAVITIWGPAPRNPRGRLRELGQEVTRTARRVSELLT